MVDSRLILGLEKIVLLTGSCPQTYVAAQSCHTEFPSEDRITMKKSEWFSGQSKRP